jgi:hypothetical protein
MISPRIRRLTRDFEKLRSRFRDWPLIGLAGTAGLPPEFYRVTYAIKGLYVDATGPVLDRSEHILELNHSLGYPRRSPRSPLPPSRVPMPYVDAGVSSQFR